MRAVGFTSNHQASPTNRLHDTGVEASRVSNLLDSGQKILAACGDFEGCWRR
jgi:hypothetical protein